MAEIILSTGLAAATPGNGKITFYAKSSDKLLYFKDDAGVEHSLSGGLASLNALVATSQTFADVDDTNVTLTIVSAGSTHTFTLGWTGTLALARLAASAQVSRLLGRGSGAGVGSFEEITLGTGLTMNGTTLNSGDTMKSIKSVSGSLTADTDVIAAVGGKRLKVIAYSLVSVGTNANTVIFKSNGTGGTELWRVLLQSSTAIASGANLATSPPDWLFGTVVSEKLTIDVNQTDAVHYSISYFDDDAS